MTPHHPAYEGLARLVAASTSLAFPAWRRDSVANGIARAMVRDRLTDPADYLERLSRAELSLDALIDELTVGETFFFRDSAIFDLMRHTILPDLRRRRDSDHVVSAWSAGCASGEEAYSLAIVLEEEGLAPRSRILATDISEAALAKARAATYGAWSMRSCPHDTIGRYFDRKGAQYSLARRIRGRIAFDRLNLACDPFPGHRADAPTMDIILCRNVLIYLEPAKLPEIAQRLFGALAEGGWLLTGPSDPLLSSHAPFDVTMSPAGLVYRRLDHPAPGVQAQPSLAPVAEEPTAATGPADTGDTGNNASAPHEPLQSARSEDEAAACEARILSFANRGDHAAAEALAAAVSSKTGSAASHLVHAATLMELRRYPDAAKASRRAIYLDAKFTVAHLVLGTILCRLGAVGEAARAYRNGYALAAARPPDELVPGTNGERAGALAQAAKAQMALLAGSKGGP